LQLSNGTEPSSTAVDFIPKRGPHQVVNCQTCHGGEVWRVNFDWTHLNLSTNEKTNIIILDKITKSANLDPIVVSLNNCRS
jgi:hypothetical protein